MEFNPYDPALHQDPYPVYRRLRDEFPLHYNEELNFWSLSRYADVFEALQKPDLYCSGKGITVGLGEMPGDDKGGIPLLIMTDRPRHTELRALVSRAFAPRRVAALEPRVRSIARRLLDDFWEQKEADLVRDFSGPLPTIVIAELLGVPGEDQKWFKEKSTAIAQFDPANPRGIHPAAREAGPAVELAGYFTEVLEERRKVPRDDLLSALLAAEIDGESLTQRELIGFAFLLLVAGNETTTNLISNAAVQLDRHLDQRQQLLDNPALIPNAVEEFLRFDSPVQGLARTTTTEVSIHGRTIPENSKVLLLFASANRDERKIADPDRFDVTRAPNPHLTFGFGTHFCLGASLARLEARVAYEELLSRLPHYRLKDSRVERLCSGPIRGAVTLPISTGR